MRNDPKFVELTADVLKIFFNKKKTYEVFTYILLKHEWRISDNFELRSPVIQKKALAKHYTCCRHRSTRVPVGRANI